MTAPPNTPADRAAAVLGEELGGWTPSVALILGSGLGRLAARMHVLVDVPFARLPDLPAPTVSGHGGHVVAGTLDGVGVLAFAGRRHIYEGGDPALAAMPARVAYAVGARALFVSNAAGDIRPTLAPGDLMLIRDHINLMWGNPLTGRVAPNEIRFPDMSEAYDAGLVAALRAGAADAGVLAAEGVYAAVLGPSYETPAEVRMLGRLGADAVGMSTVPEVIAARALGMRVAGVSLIANRAAGLGDAPLDHAEVIAAGERAADAFERLVRAFVRRAFAAPADR